VGSNLGGVGVSSKKLPFFKNAPKTCFIFAGFSSSSKAHRKRHAKFFQAALKESWRKRKNQPE
jgi:hypothetical protein